MSRGASVQSKGSTDGYQTGFTVNQPWGSFLKDAKSPESWSTCSLIFCRGMGRSYMCIQLVYHRDNYVWIVSVHRQWSVPQQEILQSSCVRCWNDGRWPCNVAVVLSCSHFTPLRIIWKKEVILDDLEKFFRRLLLKEFFSEKEEKKVTLRPCFAPEHMDAS